jgi:hypothetical protein
MFSYSLFAGVTGYRRERGIDVPDRSIDVGDDNAIGGLCHGPGQFGPLKIAE